MNARAAAPGATELKVLVIPSWYPCEESPYQGLFLREQALCMAQRFAVTVLTPRYPPLSDLLRLRGGPDLIREEDRELKTWRIRYLKLPTLRRWMPLFSGPDDVLVYYDKFAEAIRRGFRRYVAEQGLPDLIHAHVVLPAGSIAVELGQTHGVPVMLTEHSGPFSMHLQTATQRRLVRETLHGADRVTAVSPALRDVMAEFCPDVPIDVIGNLIDTDFFDIAPSLRPPRSVFRFLFVGVFVEIKGVRHLLEAAGQLVASGLRNFEIYLGGDGPLGPSLKSLAKDLEIADRCRFLGMLDRAEVRRQMEDCDVFVLPSLGETFGIVIGEAMACGKPVLSTRCGGPEYLVTPETGVLVSPANPHELADAMARFMKLLSLLVDPNGIRHIIVEWSGAAVFTSDRTGPFTYSALSHSSRGRNRWRLIERPIVHQHETSSNSNTVIADAESSRWS